MKNKISYLKLIAFFMLFSLTTYSQQTKRVYMIGNSVTDGVNYYGFNTLAEDPSGPGNTHIWARHMIPGSPLFLLWNASEARNSGFVEEPFGYPSDAFVNYEWDAITLQPFDRHLINGDPVTGEGDVAQTIRYANLAKTKSPNVQFYILGRYPRSASTTNDPANDAASTAASWNTLYTSAFTGEWDGTNETRDYFEQLTAAATAANPSLTKPFRMIPLGEVMYSLNNKMIAGQVPGYSKIWQFYADGIHLNSIGSYVNACTFYATIYKESPVGRIIPSEYGSINPALALIIQQTVWEVVSTYPPAGIFGVVVVPVSSVSVTPTTLSVAINQTFQLTPTVLPSNASNQNLTWSSSNSTIATVSSSGLVTGKGVGNANITVTSAADPSKTSTCAVTVVSGNIAVTGLSIAPTTASIKVGNSSSLTLNVTPVNATNQSVNWTSSNEAIATVNTNGVVTAIQAGNATITATSVSDGSKTASCAVTALPNAAPVAVIGASVLSGAAPLVVNFNSDGSTDADAGDYVLGFEWDFDDATAIEKSASPSHTFTSAGTYVVKLRVMDNNNLYGSIVTTTINVTPGVNAISLATWDLIGVNAAGGVQTAPVTTKDANLTVSNLTVGAGMGAPNDYFKDYLGGGNMANAMTLASAIAGNNYLEFTVTPATGKFLTISSLDVCAMTQGGVGTVSLLSSVNGFTAANLISSIATGLANEVNISTQNLPVSGHVNLSSATTFRLYYNSTLDWGFDYKAVGIGNRHAANTTAALIVNGMVGVNTGWAGIKEIDFVLYPNPATDKLTLDFGTEVSNAQITILDLQGCNLMALNLTNIQTHTLDISSLKSGVYFLKVINGNKVSNNKFVKE